ncbi:MAG: Flp pilus assembly protein CpaB [Pseudomonadota bacterium]
MSIMRILILLVAAVAAIGAAFIVSNMQAQPAPAAAPTIIAQPVETELTNVLVAKNDLPIGHYLSENDLVWQPWPTDAPTSAFVTDEDDPEALEAHAGAVVRTQLVAGEPITSTKIVHPGEAGFMAAVLTPGMRAVSVEISAETAAGGFIMPNDRVDVILVRYVDVIRGDTISQSVAPDTILANIRVLAIDSTFRTEGPEDEAQVVEGTRATVELTKEDAELLSAADEMGDLHFTLRSLGEADAPSGSTPRARAIVAGDDAYGVPIYSYGGDPTYAAAGGS